MIPVLRIEANRWDGKIQSLRKYSEMYEQLNLNQSDIFSKTKLLLGVYRDVVWITLSESARVNEELAYYGEELDSALVYLELFAPDTEKQEFESRISALFENKWMVDLIDTAMAKYMTTITTAGCTTKSYRKAT